MKKEKEIMEQSPLTDEEIAKLEEERSQEWEDLLAPFKAAAEQRKMNAAIIAEHDELLSDILFEVTMNELEG